MAALDSSLLPQSCVVRDGRLIIAGIDAVTLAQEYGTPVFVYDEAHLRARCREAVQAFPGGAAYASKAFLCTAMAQLAAEEGMQIDVASGGELHVALSASFAPDKITLHGNNKSTDELTRAIEVGVGRIVVDSLDEIARLGALTAGLDDPVRVLVRVTPGVEAHTHEFVMTGQADSKFGLGLHNGDALEAISRLRAIPGVELVGIHAHLGSQILRTDSFQKAIAILADFLLSLDLNEFCIGGGLGAAYVNGEIAPTITEWGAMVHTAARDAGIPSHVRITAEPGRSIVAAAAVTLYSVGTVKKIEDIRTYVSVDGGMSDNPRPIIYGTGYEAFLPRCVDDQRTMTATIVGKHCESGDVVVRDAQIPEDIQIGDILATPVTGGYGYSMASNYNKVPRPPVVFVNDGRSQLVVRRETLGDLVRLDVGL